jgi:hypothetical protein
VLGAEDSERAERAISGNYGLARKLYEGIGNRFSSIDQVYIEIAPLSAAEVVPPNAT